MSASRRELVSSSEVQFLITDKHHVRYAWRVNDQYLNAVLKREVLTFSQREGVIEVSVRSLAQYINDAEKQRLTAEASWDTAAGALSRNASGTTPAPGSVYEPPPTLLPPSTTRTSRVSSSLPSTHHEAPLPPVYEEDDSLAEESHRPQAQPERSLHQALAECFDSDGSTLFFALANELYELSRDPFYSGGKGGEVYTLEEHCPGFRLCCAVFREVYDSSVRPKAEELVDFSHVTIEDLLRYRHTVRETFRLRQEDPNIFGPSETNLDGDWVNEYVKKDQYFFFTRQAGKPTNLHHDKAEQGRPCVHRHGGRLPENDSVFDMTLSHVPAYRTKPNSNAPGETGSSSPAFSVKDEGDAPSKENEIRTYYLTELLQNPSWEPDDACTQCRQCGSFFKSVAWPFGVRAHHCRSCGHRLCAACVTRKAHRSFAKLSKPGSSVEEPDERLVCDACYKAYLDLERHRYLGALFAFGGLDFAHLSLCRTVSRQWRYAAELCISEYRLLLHQCEPDLKSVLTPVGVLLQSSVSLIACVAQRPNPAAAHVRGNRQRTAGAAAASQRTGSTTTNDLPEEGEDPFDTSVLLSFHPEPALLLLKFIESKDQWAAPSTQRLLHIIAQCTPDHFGGHRVVVNASPPTGSPGATPGTAPGAHTTAHRFSHWHFYCTEFCSKMLPVSFAVKAAERICTAPAACRLARNALLGLAHNLLSPQVVLRKPVATSELSRAGAAPQGGANQRASRFPFFHSITSPATAKKDNGEARPPEMTAAVATAESVLVWLLDLLFRDARERDPAARKFQLLLVTVLPPLAAASVSLAIIMLCSLQSGYAFRNYDEELLGSWRTRVLEEVGTGFPAVSQDRVTSGVTAPKTNTTAAPDAPSSSFTVQRVGPAASANPTLSDASAGEGANTKTCVRQTVEATLDFFTGLDAFCAQPGAEAQSVLLSRWIKEYCATTGLPSAAATSTHSRTPSSVAPMNTSSAPIRPPDRFTAHASMSEASPLSRASPGGPGGVRDGAAASVYAARDTAPVNGSTATPHPAASTSHPMLAKGDFEDLPHPIYNPFKPDIVLRSIRVSSIRVEETSSTRPVWLTFSTYTNADRAAFAAQEEAKRLAEKKQRAEERAAKKAGRHLPAKTLHKDPSASVSSSAMVHEQICEFLYKRENAERDQLMCISGRLLQLFLHKDIGDAVLSNYSVLPLSCDSALIEKADGYILSKLPGTGASADITGFLSQLGDSGKRNFLASAKLFLLMNYIFSIGDRHQGNVMVSYQGAILHIDFGFIFSERTFVEMLAGSTMRIDNQFLAAVVHSRRALREKQRLAIQEAALLPTPQRGLGGLFSRNPVVPPMAENALASNAHAPPSHAGALTVADAARAAAAPSAPRTVTVTEEYDAFFNEAADWFLALRPHAAEFYDIWLYAANRSTLSFTPRQLTVAINCLFDRNASRESSRDKFVTTMRQSINVCRLKDVTHSSMQVLKAYSEEVSRRVTDGGYEMVRSLGSLWGSWKK